MGAAFTFYIKTIITNAQIIIYHKYLSFILHTDGVITTNKKRKKVVILPPFYANDYILVALTKDLMVQRLQSLTTLNPLNS